MSLAQPVKLYNIRNHALHLVTCVMHTVYHPTSAWHATEPRRSRSPDRETADVKEGLAMRLAFAESAPRAGFCYTLTNPSSRVESCSKRACRARQPLHSPLPRLWSELCRHLSYTPDCEVAARSSISRPAVCGHAPCFRPALALSSGSPSAAIAQHRLSLPTLRQAIRFTYKAC